METRIAINPCWVDINAKVATGWGVRLNPDIQRLQRLQSTLRSDFREETGSILVNCQCGKQFFVELSRGVLKRSKFLAAANNFVGNDHSRHPRVAFESLVLDNTRRLPNGS